MIDIKHNDNKMKIKVSKPNLVDKYSFNITKERLLDGIIMSEILGQPKGRKGLMYNVHKSTNSR